MSQKIVAGNWKMNKNLQEGIQLANEVDQLVSGLTTDVKVTLAPPFTHITEVRKAVSSKIAVSSQNCAAEVSGAYTGEVSASMIKSTGAEYAIIGHSERRAYYGDTDAILLKKVKLALANGL